MLYRTLVMLCCIMSSHLITGAARAQESPFIPTEENSWVFKAETDVDAESPIDLRGLNEKEAGEHGFIRVSDDGRGFVRGDGKPIRFWATHSTNIAKMSDEDVRRYTRFLARMGVNLGLAGSALQPAPKQPDINKTHPDKLDETWRMVAAFKKQGIYSEIRGTWFYGGFAKVEGIEGYSAKDGMQSVIFFSPKLQKAYRSWLEDLLTRKNPYTGIPLKDDPALMSITFFNEDSPFFYTFKGLRGAPLRHAQEAFAAWATKKYGSLAAAMKTWDGSMAGEGDAVGDGRLGFLNWWFATEEGRKQLGNPQRLKDQLTFVAQTQREYYEEMKRWLREDLGCRQLVMTSNFRPAVPPLMQDLENWVKAAGDVIVLNSYPGLLEHHGTKRGYMIQVGDFVSSTSGTRRPLELAQAHRQVAGKPFMVSETLWPNPHEYSNESALLNAIFANVAGMGGSSFAGPRDIGHSSASYYFGFGKKGKGLPIRKWNSSEPGHLAGYPVAALIARRGYGVQTKAAMIERRPFKELISLEPPLLPEGLDFDPLYASDEEQRDSVKAELPPEAFLMGPVLVDFEEGETEIAEQVKAFDPKSPVVKSLDGAVTWHRAKGLTTLDTPEAQVVVGSLKANSPVTLTDVTISSENEHISVALIALDGKPIRESGKLLLQLTPRVRPSGWQLEKATHADKKSGKTLEGWKIVNTGSLPFRAENVNASMSIRNAHLSKATVLDEMGRTKDTTAVKKADGAITLTLPPNAVWLLLQ